MNILVTNDDGIKAAGLRAIVKELASLGNVYVVAPNGQCSAYSHKMTLRGSLRFEEREVPGAKKAFALWGTPVDCVHVGCNFLVGEKIDLVVSGINKGPNLSTDIIYSGTIAAAREAFIHHIPSVALSLNSFTVRDFLTRLLSPFSNSSYSSAARQSCFWAVSRETVSCDELSSRAVSVSIPSGSTV